MKINIRNIIAVLITMIFIGCAAHRANVNKDVLTKSDAVGEVVYEDRTYYIVQLADLTKARKPSSLTYVGTEDNYHLFRVWSKIAYTSGEIHFFAVTKEQCVVCQESTIKYEETYVETVRKGWRGVSLVNGQCNVACIKE